MTPDFIYPLAGIELPDTMDTEAAGPRVDYFFRDRC